MSDTPTPPPAADDPESSDAADAASSQALPAAEGAVSSYTTDGKPRAGCLFVILPVFLAAGILIAYVVLFGVGSMGFTATGDRVRLHVQTCEQARPLIQARVDMMGLGDPAFTDADDGFVIEATLPNTPAAATAPTTLVRGGDFVVRQGTDGPQVLGPDAVETAEFSLKELGNPLVVVTLTREAQKTLEKHMEDHVEDEITVWIDQEMVFQRANDPPFRRREVDLRAEGDDGQQNMTRAVDWAMVMTHGPLPCPARITSRESLTGG